MAGFAPCPPRRIGGPRRLQVISGLVALLAAAPASWAGSASTGGLAAPPVRQAQPLPASTPDQQALSDHLRRKGALFYGAWWCPACARQKALFGRQASESLPYVECDQDDSGRERCQAATVRAYPTWVLGPSRLEGVQSLEELKVWSGFSSQP